MPFRVGIGYDAHRLVTGRDLVLCGVKLPFERGLDGHSDADAPVHAIMDALLGAAGLGDIGRHFPDTDARYKNISSLKLLSEVSDLIRQNGYAVANIDAVIIAQKPKLSPFFAEMAGNVAAALGVPAETVNIKATTEEGMGFTGEGRGISAQAICLLEKL